MAVCGDGTDDELVVGCVEGVFGRSDVVLELIVTPAVGTELVLEVIRDGGRGGEGRLPVRCRRNNRFVGWDWGRVRVVWVIWRYDWMLLL